jgi:hypothetical protein
MLNEVILEKLIRMQIQILVSIQNSLIFHIVNLEELLKENNENREGKNGKYNEERSKY